MWPEVHRPTAPAAAPAGVGLRWCDSPFPFIIGGVALMLGVVPVALVLIIACSFGKLAESSTNDEKSEKPVHDLRVEMEPRVVVIMAGETNPTHIAKPIAAAVRRSEEV